MCLRDYICNIIMIRLRLDNTDNCNISYNNKYLNTRGLINRLASRRRIGLCLRVMNVKYENTASGVTTWLMSRSHFLWHFGVKVRPLNDHRGRAVTVLFNWN